MIVLSNSFVPIPPVSVTTASGLLFGAVSGVRTVALVNNGSYDVWLALRPHEAKVGFGFWLAAGTEKIFDVNSLPVDGFNAIANGGTTTVSIGMG